MRNCKTENNQNEKIQKKWPNGSDSIATGVTEPAYQQNLEIPEMSLSYCYSKHISYTWKAIFWQFLWFTSKSRENKWICSKVVLWRPSFHPFSMWNQVSTNARSDKTQSHIMQLLTWTRKNQSERHFDSSQHTQIQVILLLLSYYFFFSLCPSCIGSPFLYYLT